MQLERYLDFSKIVAYVHSNVIHKFMFPLLFSLCKQLLVKLLYGLLYSKVIVLTLFSLAIFISFLIQMIHIG